MDAWHSEWILCLYVYMINVFEIFILVWLWLLRPYIIHTFMSHGTLVLFRKYWFFKKIIHFYKTFYCRPWVKKKIWILQSGLSIEKVYGLRTPYGSYLEALLCRCKQKLCNNLKHIAYSISSWPLLHRITSLALHYLSRYGWYWVSVYSCIILSC